MHNIYNIIKNIKIYCELKGVVFTFRIAALNRKIDLYVKI